MLEKKSLNKIKKEAYAQILVILIVAVHFKYTPIKRKSKEEWERRGRCKSGVEKGRNLEKRIRMKTNKEGPMQGCSYTMCHIIYGLVFYFAYRSRLRGILVNF